MNITANFWKDKRIVRVLLEPVPNGGALRLLSENQEIGCIQIQPLQRKQPKCLFSFMSPESTEELEVEVFDPESGIHRVGVFMDFSMEIDEQETVPQPKEADPIPEAVLYPETPDNQPSIIWKMGDSWHGNFTPSFLLLLNEQEQQWDLKDPETFYPVINPERKNLLGDMTVKEFPSAWSLSGEIKLTPIVSAIQDMGVYGIRCRNTIKGNYGLVLTPPIKPENGNQDFWFSTYIRIKDWDNTQETATLSFIIKEFNKTKKQWTQQAIPIPMLDKWELFKEKFELQPNTDHFRIGFLADNFEKINNDFEIQLFLPTLTDKPSWLPLLSGNLEPEDSFEREFSANTLSSGTLEATLEWDGQHVEFDLGFLALYIGSKVRVKINDKFYLETKISTDLGFEPVESTGSLWYDKHSCCLMVKTQTGFERINIKPGTQRFKLAWQDGIAQLYLNDQLVKEQPIPDLTQFENPEKEYKIRVSGKASAVLWSLSYISWI